MTSDKIARMPTADQLTRVGTLVAVACRSLQADGACAVMLDEDSEPILLGRVGSHVLIETLVAREGSLPGGRAFGAGSQTDFYASAPFAIDGSRRGLLCVFGAVPRELGDESKRMLETFANGIAASIASPAQGPVMASGAGIASPDVQLRLLESVVVNANDAVVICEAEPFDEPGPRIVYVNAAFTRMTGYSLEEVVGKSARILQGPETSGETRRQLGEALRRWESVVTELVNYRKDGTPFWVELSIFPVPDENGIFTHWVSVQREVTERKRAEELAVRARVAEAERTVLAEHVSRDDLTGLCNRATFVEHVAAAIQASHADAYSRAAVLFLDLDRFKVINDSLGHSSGDSLLVEIATRLHKCIRGVDVLARWGGDEFSFLLNGLADEEHCVAIARRVLRALAEPVSLGGRSVSVAGSIGITMVDGRYQYPEEVLRDADTAMYRAKADGGARFALFDETMHARALTALHALTDLTGALARDEFVLHYQPIVQLADGRATGFEALLRWNNPDRGLVLPGDFIPLVEETGFIVAIGAWVLQQACARAAIWNAGRPGRFALSVNVNVSSRQLTDRDFLAILQHALDTSGLDPRALQIEITESVFLQHPESVGAVLERIRALGVRIALDDFGTGYSSLSYLERYPIDTLKIDRSFVQRLTTSKTTAEIVRMIVGLGNALDMEVTAEGVEQAAQLQLVKDCGCSHVQGYLLSRPIAESGVPDFIEASDGLQSRLSLPSGGRDALRSGRSRELRAGRELR